ncbi:Homeodomain-like domain-containing protein [Nocardioides alpinus]|uniref:Helix-turn-helix transcriptional regulator n=1 Tax=Nocardioides alpinus TaxID=748909 RepID=A0A1I0WAG7_9ACTN|nr:helix-turn-helix domain-containing protein [Nocardioides alpinus]PKH37778.1 helix-turn-helix transcriptional regulator [Nocardioides alpinus]SFA85268.1 Homeodomain-like domain-containing protein [Nocardioides alpinus]
MKDSAVVGALGLPTQMEPVYLRVLAGSGQSIDQVAASMLLSPERLLVQLEPLMALGIVTVDGGVLHVIDPATATSRALAAQAAGLGVAANELARMAEVLPLLAERPDRHVTDDQQIDGDVSSESDVPGLIAQWIREKRGDLCFLRPDQWRLPSESDMAVAVGNAVRESRRVRAIYPARAMSEAPHMLRMRAEIGEEIRVVPSVLTRMVIVGPRRAIVPEPLGTGSDRRVVVRQESLVGVLQAYFDELWETASRVDGRGDRLAEHDHRRLLLAELADGVKDEQIARNLDISLRTVRRRVAALMSELGVDTRFQAGVEAVRRGWL